MLTTWVGTLLICAAVDARSSYVALLPNGGNVPNPCVTNSIYQAIGHENAAGGGSRNKFGSDFSANSLTYNAAFCRLDSDGDGKTNGEELGDPNCVWTQGQPNPSGAVTHPGVCTPIDSAVCKAINPCNVCISVGAIILFCSYN
ncbi:hypothetical protein Ciccas_009087 [Cichlidogyrus casuarinus]|uniref:Temptin Cys/Cys disulfide domain-containing protein n=1 Tax=Cichlidogyrus casuarinus TaxID=1844966 RepID=A0ABD2PY20_9PLAT